MTYIKKKDEESNLALYYGQKVTQHKQLLDGSKVAHMHSKLAQK